MLKIVDGSAKLLYSLSVTLTSLKEYYCLIKLWTPPLDLLYIFLVDQNVKYRLDN